MATGLCGTCGGSTPGCGCHVTAGTGIAVTGDGSSGSPFVVTNIPVAGDGIAVSGSTISAKNRKQLSNPVRNASFAVAQRGTSVSPAAAGGTTLDGWIGYRTGAVAGITVSQQTTLADSLGSGYCARVQRDNANASTAVTALMQSIPTLDSRRFAGRASVLSFRARSLANFSAASGVLVSSVYSGTGTDQSLLSGLSGQATLVAQNNTLTSSFQTFTVAFTPGSSATQLALQFSFTPVGTAGALDAFEIKDVRIDEGSYALEHVPLPYALALAECRRFFRRDGGAASASIGFGIVTGATTASVQLHSEGPMRAIPTISVNGTIGLLNVNDAGAAPAVTALAGSSITSDSLQWIDVTAGGGGLTTGRACRVYTSGAVSIDRSAEI